MIGKNFFDRVLVRKRKRAINQIKMLLIQFGIIIDDIAEQVVIGIPKYIRNSLLKLDLPSVIKLTVQTHLETIDFFEAKIKTFDKLYKNGPEESNFKKNWEILKTIPGIGDLTATALIYEIGNWSRFENEKEISAYLGMTPSEFSSGENINKGRITGQGNTWLRSGRLHNDKNKISVLK